jgi:hypothetical protein
LMTNSLGRRGSVGQIVVISFCADFSATQVMSYTLDSVRAMRRFPAWFDDKSAAL